MAEHRISAKIDSFYPKAFVRDKSEKESVSEILVRFLFFQLFYETKGVFLGPFYH